MRTIRNKTMQSNWVIPLAGALALMTANAFAQSLPPINLLHENPKRQLTREEKEYQKQLDNDYKATMNKLPEQKANDPWATVRPTVTCSQPKETEISERNAIGRGGSRQILESARSCGMLAGNGGSRLCSLDH